MKNTKNALKAYIVNVAKWYKSGDRTKVPKEIQDAYNVIEAESLRINKGK